MDGDDLTVQQILSELELHQKVRDRGCPTFVSPERVRKAMGLPEPECDLPIGEQPTSNWDVSPVPTPVANLLEFQRELKAMGGQKSEFATAIEDLRKEVYDAISGCFLCESGVGGKHETFADDVATPVIVEANPPR